MKTAERIVITGMGAVTPLGLSAQDTFSGLVAGRSGLQRMHWPAEAELSNNVGAPVVGFVSPGELWPSQRPLTRVTQFAMSATREAIEQASLRGAGYESDRIATILGIGMGDASSVQMASAMFEADAGFSIAPNLVADMVPSAVNDLVARYVQASGPCYCVVSACASAGHAIGEAFELLRSGAVDVAITGGAEAVLDPMAIATFERIGALSQFDGPPEKASRPFDRERNGFVMGEGAAVLVLETLRGARRRGAHIYAEIAGYGASTDAFHVTRPCEDGEGMAASINAALCSAGLEPEQVQYVNAHGTGTPFNDEAETLAIKRAFGAHAKKLWISSNKSMTGHLLGAAAGAETIATAYTLANQIVPPTLNLEYPDEKCDLDYVPFTARAGQIKVAINNAFGFGGQNACLVLAVPS
jgi:3-oxoacyl-[acyl-carrier-protein] synthase II